MHEHGRGAGSGAGVEAAHGIAELGRLQIRVADGDGRDARLILALEAVQHCQGQDIVDPAHGGVEHDAYGRFGYARKLHVT